MTELVYGLHAVVALLANPHRQTKKLYINQERVDKPIQEILRVALQQQILVEHCSLQKMNQRFESFVHQGVVAEAGALPNYGESDLEQLLAMTPSPHLILILDGITDPHNLGACLRSADAAGVNFVIIPKDKNANISPAVSKVACGAAESVPLVRVTNLVRAMESLKQSGVWIYGAAGEATSSLYDLDCSTSLALVMGSEDKGMRHLTRERCDDLFSLPMLGTVSSLNVSVATGVSLYEVVRQRKA
jgi:23S rRNA (guanosine2251-2'-O)-methyltransferase